MPWVDIDFILEAQQIWADKYARGRCYRHYEIIESATRDLYENNVHARDQYMQHVRQHEEKTWNFDARACFEADYERALQFPPAVENMYKNSLWGSAEVHPYVRVPIDLITGPWDEEKKRRLFWFVRTGVVQLSKVIGYSKVRLAGLDAAMISPEKPDPLVIKCLMPTLLYKAALPPRAAHNRLVKLCRRIRQRGGTQNMRKFPGYVSREMHMNQETALRRHPYDSSTVLIKATTVYANWDLQLPHVTKVLNARYVQSVGFSPVEILYGLSRSPDVGVKSFLTQASSAWDGPLRKSLAWWLEASLDGDSRVRWIGRSEKRRARVERKGQIKAAARKDCHAQRHSKPFVPGDMVMVVSEGKPPKLKPRWQGPFELRRVLVSPLINFPIWMVCAFVEDLILIFMRTLWNTLYHGRDICRH
ncbi:hypothetical protein E4U52_006340 [Claviceps spartinae]|nr:hypothetical protein E4U52_006340 [Claviceps spartinae]